MESEKSMNENEEFEFALAREKESAKENPPLSFGQKAWNFLSIPEKKSKEGLKILSNMIPNPEPSGNLPMDIIKGTPKIAAETLAETAPGFVSPLSIALSGTLGAAKIAKPLIKAGGKMLGRGLEAASGLSYKTPGILAETVSDPSLPFGKGLDAARSIYKGVQDSGNVAKELSEPLTHQEYIGRSLEKLKSGSLTPEEALEARKSLDKIRKTLTDVGYKKTREIFDAFAKEKFAKADQAYARAIKSEALRQFFPVNKGGTPSIFKVGIGGATIPHLMPFTSPMVQGLGASGVGLIGKTVSPLIENPSLGTALPFAIKRRRNLLPTELHP